MVRLLVLNYSSSELRVMLIFILISPLQLITSLSREQQSASSRTLVEQSCFVLESGHVNQLPVSSHPMDGSLRYKSGLLGVLACE